MSECPSVSASGLTCDREDDYSSHKSLTHRNTEAQRDWYILPLDRVRWGVVGPKKKKTTNVADEVSEEAIEDEGDGQEEHMESSE